MNLSITTTIIIITTITIFMVKFLLFLQVVPIIKNFPGKINSLIQLPFFREIYVVYFNRLLLVLFNFNNLFVILFCFKVSKFITIIIDRHPNLKYFIGLIISFL